MPDANHPNGFMTSIESVRIGMQEQEWTGELLATLLSPLPDDGLPVDYVDRRRVLEQRYNLRPYISQVIDER